MSSTFSLINEFYKEVAKDKSLNNRATMDAKYSTGFANIDYLNGEIMEYNGELIDSPGFVDGSPVMIIGRTGCGKTTLANQMAGNIIRPFEYGSIIYEDMESGVVENRAKNMMLMSDEEYLKRVDRRNSGITTESIYKKLMKYAKMKQDNYDIMTYDTGLIDIHGNKVIKYQPTVCIIDSLPMLMTDDIMEENELGGNMLAASIARNNTQLVKKMAQICKPVNIILFVINHIMDDISINPMQKSKAQIAGLKQSERLPGGKAAQYLSNNMMRVDDSTKLKASEGFGIDGSVVNISFIKSRTNVTLKSVPMVYDFRTGFDNILSLYQLLKEAGRINGAGSYFYIGDYSDEKFSQKTFKNKLLESPKLQEVFAKECSIVLKDLLSPPINKAAVTSFDINSMINKM